MLYYVLQYVLLTLICAYLVQRYSSPSVSIHVKLWSIITWVLNFALALLVPEDVYETLKGAQQDALGTHYKLLYWSVYVLTWTVIPVLQEWEDAGDLRSVDRLKRSLKSNGWFYLFMLIGGVVGLVALILINAGGSMGLVTFLRCLATSWGIFLLMGLLGYALAEIPKTMWRNADPKQYILYIYYRIGQAEEDVEESYVSFNTVYAFVQYLSKNAPEAAIQEYINASLGMVPPFLKTKLKSNYESFLKDTGYIQSYPINLESAIEHHRLMRRAIARCNRQQKILQEYLREAVFYEDVNTAIAANTHVVSRIKPTSAFTSAWYTNYRVKVQTVCAGLLGLFSILLLVAETQVFFGSTWTVFSKLMLIENLQVLRVVVFLVMALIIYMANYALFRLKLADLYGLYWRESDGASLMFATINFSRIGVALVLNFFDMVKMSNSVYSEVMAAPDMGLLGDWVIKGLPGLLWLVVVVHYFNVWGFITKKLNVEDSFSFVTHELQEGKVKNSPYHVAKLRKTLQKEPNPSGENKANLVM